MTAVASSSSPSPAKHVQTRALFPSQPVEYMHLLNSDGCLFIVDMEAMNRFSGTMSAMIDAQATLNDIGIENNNLVSIHLSDLTFLGITGVIQYIYWRKRWINVVVDKIQDWKSDGCHQLVQEIAVAAHFFEV